MRFMHLLISPGEEFGQGYSSIEMVTSQLEVQQYSSHRLPTYNKPRNNDNRFAAGINKVSTHHEAGVHLSGDLIRDDVDRRLPACMHEGRTGQGTWCLTRV